MPFRITPDMIEALRRRNIAPPPVPVQDEPSMRMVSPLDEIDNVDRPAFDGYRQHLQSMPRREDTAPSFGRKALSGVVGALQAAATGNPGAGMETAERLRDARYNNSLADWSREGIGQKALVDLENNDATLQLQRVRALNDAAYKEGQLHNSGRRTDAQISHYGAQERNWDRTDENADLERQRRAAADADTSTYRNRVAATGERNASTNEQRAHDYHANVEGLNTYRSRKGIAKKVPSPAAQKTAREEAMKEAIAADATGTWKNFIDPDTLTFKPPQDTWMGLGDPSEEDVTTYEELRKAVRQGISSRLGGWVPPALEEDDNGDDDGDEI